MKRIAWGIVVGGVAAAAFAGSGVAGATGETWTPDYDVNGAQLFLGPDGASPAWELPASFTSSSGTTLTGADYLTTSPGGFNDQFITDTGAIYDQDQMGGGFTNLYYYDPVGDSAPVDIMKTPFGTVDLSSMASLFAPHDFGAVTSLAGPIGDNNIGAALGLYDKIGGLWTGLGSAGLTALQGPDSSSLVWSTPVEFSGGSGADATTLTGTEYVLSLNNVEFVDNAGDVFGQHELFPFVDNLYYDPAGGPAQDYLQTMFGLVDLSSVASWFAPADVSDLVAASPLADLADAGLYSVLDLGLPS